MPAIGGDFTLTLAGRQIVTAPDCAVRLTGDTREAADVIARDGKPRFTSRKTSGMVKFKAVLDPNQDTTWLIGLTNVSGTLESVSGKKYRIANASRIGEPPEINQADGTLELEFVGDVKEQS